MEKKLNVIPEDWREIDEKKYTRFGIVADSEVKIIKAWGQSDENRLNIITLYNYGLASKIVKELKESYDIISQEENVVNEYGFSIIWHDTMRVGSFDCFVSVIQPKDSSCYVTDIFFEYEKHDYCFHVMSSKTFAVGKQGLLSQRFFQSIKEVLNNK